MADKMNEKEITHTSNKRYTLGEEIFNSVSHGLGAALAVAGCVLLIIFAALHSDALGIVSAALYGASLIVLYMASTLYHSLVNEKAKAVFRIFDHCSIFILIAGTYTPYCFVTLRGTAGYVLGSLIWAMAILGIVLNAVNLEKFEKISVLCYLIMGWAVVFTIKPLINALALGGLLLLALGGVMYTLGIIFFLMKRAYMHSIWHLFVLAGSVLQFFSVLLYVY